MKKRKRYAIFALGALALLALVGALGLGQARKPCAAAPALQEWWEACPPDPPTSTPWPPQPTYTPRPTYAPQATYTPEPTPTCRPTATLAPNPSPTPYPTSTLQPTHTPYPTSTPYPTQPAVTPESTDTPEPTATPDGAASYYVAPDGDDANPGTREEPWRTIQHAADAMPPGETAVILTGTYAERVDVTRSDLAFAADGLVEMRGFRIDAERVTVRGFYITGTEDDDYDGWCIYAVGSGHVIEDNHGYYCVRGGIWVNRRADPAASASCVVRGNRLERVAMVGIEVHGRDHLIEGNEVWGTIQYHPGWADPPGYVDADGMRYFGDGHTFRGNYIHDITYDDPENLDPHIDAFQTWGGGWEEGGTHVTFDGNYIDVRQSTAADAPSCQGWMVEGGGYLTITNNVVRAYEGVNVQGVPSVFVAHNTFTGDPRYTSYWPTGVEFVGSPGGVCKNNVFYDVTTGNAGYFIGAGDVGNNLVYLSDGSEPPGSQYPGDLWAVDPLFVSAAGGDFHLLAGSPCIGAGLDLGVVTDYDGDARDAEPDIGAFEGW